MCSTLLKVFLLWGFATAASSQWTEDFTTEENSTPYYNCGENFYDVSGVFTSPNYPSNYPDYTDCVWVISETRGFGKPAVHFYESFDTEECCDFLEFRDGPFPNSPLIARYNGQLSFPGSVYSQSRDMWIWFHTDGSVNRKGFRAYFSAYDSGPTGTYSPSSDHEETTLDPTTSGEIWTTVAPECGQNFTNTYGTFTSPYWPANYPNNADCYWIISNTMGYYPDVYFMYPVIMENGHDFIEFRDGPNSNSPFLARLTGTIANPPYIHSSSGYLWIWFHSDVSITGQGFRADFTYQTIPGPSTSQSPEEPTYTTPSYEITTSSSDYCDQDFYDNWGTFRSPNFPYNYPLNVDCIWRFYAPGGATIHITVAQFLNIEDDRECNYDYLEFRDGPHPTSNLITKICGPTTSPVAVRSSTNALWVRFHSDHQVPDTGFVALYQMRFGVGEEKVEKQVRRKELDGPNSPDE